MPKEVKALNDRQVRALGYAGNGAPSFHPVGGATGLYLQISPTGSRSWVLRYVSPTTGKRRGMGLGSFPDVGLSEARDIARDHRGTLRSGKDPLEKRRAAVVTERRQAMTLNRAFEEYMPIKLAEFTSEAHRMRWANSVRDQVLPIIGDVPLSDITHEHVLQVIEPMWLEKTVTANKIRIRIESMLDWATVKGYRSGDNPARWKGFLSHLLPAPGKVHTEEHHPALQIADAPRWFAALRRRAGAGARALEFLTLTAARTGDVRGARWAEIDLERKVWSIPAERMKMKRPHEVPLSTTALALLETLPRTDDLVFPAHRGGTLSINTLNASMKRLHDDDDKGFVDRTTGRPAVPHGMRSTFREWAGENGMSRELAELALAHRFGNAVEQAYQRSAYVEQRRPLMESWAAFLNGDKVGKNVIGFRHG